MSLILLMAVTTTGKATFCDDKKKKIYCWVQLQYIRKLFTINRVMI